MPLNLMSLTEVLKRVMMVLLSHDPNLDYLHVLFVRELAPGVSINPVAAGVRECGVRECETEYPQPSTEDSTLNHVSKHQVQRLLKHLQGW